MKSANVYRINHVQTDIPHCDVSKITSKPLSEQEILDLQEKFLSYGFHYLDVNNVQAGRVLVTSFLDSLHCYAAVGCLSLEHAVSKIPVLNVFQELKKNNCLEGNGYYLEEYLLEEFHCDFLWIEASKEMLESSWYVDVYHKLIELKLDMAMPVIIMRF